MSLFIPLQTRLLEARGHQALVQPRRPFRPQDVRDALHRRHVQVDQLRLQRLLRLRAVTRGYTR